MIQVSVDFTDRRGRIKPLHGVNNSPVTHGQPITAFQEAGVPYVRLHDAMGAYGGTCYVDIPNIFTDFSADENDPACYHFEFTDAYLAGLTASGCKIFYRLGVTIENYYQIRRIHSFTPGDFEKWARICEHIIAHYNEGWADGFHMGIEYWEIWNEPENPPMWSGTREDYFRLYEITATHLKKRFPEIKVGGYAGCGFYCVTRDNMDEFYESFMDWFDLFLERMSGRVPVDFFSWHLYTADPREIEAHARYVADKLYAYGYYDTENIFDEWNYMNDLPTRFDDMKTAEGASFVAAAFSVMQNGPIDKAMYYDAMPSRAYGGLFHFPSGSVTKTWYAFKAFNCLYRLGASVAVHSGDNCIYPVAAVGNREKAVLISSFSCNEECIWLDLKGMGEGLKQADVYCLDADNDLALTKIEYFASDHAKMLLRSKDQTVFLIVIKEMPDVQAE